jgi:hypothetical protein
MNLCDELGYHDGVTVALFMGKDLRDCTREELYAIISHLGRAEREASRNAAQASIDHVADLGRLARQRLTVGHAVGSAIDDLLRYGR